MTRIRTPAINATTGPMLRLKLIRASTWRCGERATRFRVFVEHSACPIDASVLVSACFRASRVRRRMRSARLRSGGAMLIRDILNLKGGTLYTVEPDAALADAVSLMVARDIGSLVVVRDGAMAGLLTFREVLRALERDDGTLARVRVSDIMVADPVYGSPADTIDELREVMTQNHVRYLPVIDSGKLIGIVSFHDVAKAVIKETSMENRLLRRYIEQAPEIDAQA